MELQKFPAVHIEPVENYKYRIRPIASPHTTGNPITPHPDKNRDRSRREHARYLAV